MKRLSGSYGSGGEGAKVHKKVGRFGAGRHALSRVSAAYQNDMRIEGKSVAPGSLDMPDRDEFRTSLDDGYCWWCGRTHSKSGTRMRSWSLHFSRAHGLDLAELRDILVVPGNYAFITEDLAEQLSERSKKAMRADPGKMDRIRSSRAGGKRKMSRYGRRVQKEKCHKLHAKLDGTGVYRGANREFMKRMSAIRQKNLEAQRVPRECECCGEMFTPDRLRGKTTRTTCSKTCWYKIRSERMGKTNRIERVCTGCGKSFWLPGNRRTCSAKCAHEAVSREARKPEKHARGEAVATATLRLAEVLEIRQRYARGDVSQSILAREYGITQSTVSTIVLGTAWTHAGGPLAEKKDPVTSGSRSRVST